MEKSLILPEPLSDASINSQESARRRPRRNKSNRPPLSYIALIAFAISESPQKKLTVGQIYKYISDHYPYYRDNGKKWQNSIRHNLTLNDCFVKIPREAGTPGKGCYWTIHHSWCNMFSEGSLRRRKKRSIKSSGHLKGNSSGAISFNLDSQTASNFAGSSTFFFANTSPTLDTTHWSYENPSIIHKSSDTSVSNNTLYVADNYYTSPSFPNQFLQPQSLTNGFYSSHSFTDYSNWTPHYTS